MFYLDLFKHCTRTKLPKQLFPCMKRRYFTVKVRKQRTLTAEKGTPIQNQRKQAEKKAPHLFRWRLTGYFETNEPNKCPDHQTPPREYQEPTLLQVEAVKSNRNATKQAESGRTRRCSNPARRDRRHRSLSPPPSEREGILVVGCVGLGRGRTGD